MGQEMTEQAPVADVPRKRIFILEDDPERIRAFRANLLHCDLTVATDIEAAKRAWQPPYDVASLDHDLGGEQYVNSANYNTGAEFVRWLTRFRPNLIEEATTVYVHSYNPEGASLMLSDLWQVHHRVGRLPFGPVLLKELAR
jgi:hypothetical protein